MPVRSMNKPDKSCNGSQRAELIQVVVHRLWATGGGAAGLTLRGGAAYRNQVELSMAAAACPRVHPLPQGAQHGRRGWPQPQQTWAVGVDFPSKGRSRGRTVTAKRRPVILRFTSGAPE
ncbi:hypothetical protein GCM10009663_18570 [Kitasatospora arboriphila]|uniref:Uncharacterized protein n=1 Tax=Kitasatospora arboriphila TaxID=258052 RepID=A0ABN1TDT8_9ACTN